MRILGYLLALLLGLATGLAGVAVHRRPVGLVLAVATVLVTVWALRQWRRTAVVWFAAGWLVVLGAGLLGRPEGDIVVGGDLPGWVLIGTGFLLVVQAATALGSREPPGRGFRGAP